jgi:uncharacterized protein (DUF983 family)
MKPGLPELFVLLIFGTVLVIPYWQIFKKAGFSSWLSLLMFIPLINLGMIYYLAFAKWPNRSSSK